MQLYFEDGSSLSLDYQLRFSSYLSSFLPLSLVRSRINELLGVFTVHPRWGCVEWT